MSKAARCRRRYGSHFNLRRSSVSPGGCFSMSTLTSASASRSAHQGGNGHDQSGWAHGLILLDTNGSSSDKYDRDLKSSRR
jgi:hypothetical protein